MANVPTIIVDTPTSSNVANLTLLNCGLPVLLGGITCISLVMSNGYEVKSTEYPSVITWNRLDPYKNPGNLSIVIGKLGPTTPFRQGSTYECQIKVYDVLNKEGLYWGNIRIIAV